MGGDNELAAPSLGVDGVARPGEPGVGPTGEELGEGLGRGTALGLGLGVGEGPTGGVVGAGEHCAGGGALGVTKKVALALTRAPF
jgi:hypothetical protein